MSHTYSHTNPSVYFIALFLSFSFTSLCGFMAAHLTENMELTSFFKLPSSQLIGSLGSVAPIVLMILLLLLCFPFKRYVTVLGWHEWRREKETLGRQDVHYWDNGLVICFLTCFCFLIFLDQTFIQPRSMERAGIITLLTHSDIHIMSETNFDSVR